MRKEIILILLVLVICVFSTSTTFAEQRIVSAKAVTPPIIDGDISEQTWQAVKPVPIKDQASGDMILLRSVYSGDKVYFSVWVPDKAKNPYHKPWIWDEDKKGYETGAHREDTFVFKWSMMDKKVNLSNFSDDNYNSDVWYWKANRTNPAGYADDKSQQLSDSPSGKSVETVSSSGKKRYLSRRSDQGKPAYKEFKPTEYTEHLVDRYPKSQPEGSRADVAAKGKWQDGVWIIEFERSLNTGNNDDVQFDLSKEYLFGVSIFSLYGRPHDPNSPNFYGRGRISEPLILSFEK